MLADDALGAPDVVEVRVPDHDPVALVDVVGGEPGARRDRRRGRCTRRGRSSARPSAAGTSRSRTSRASWSRPPCNTIRRERRAATVRRVPEDVLSYCRICAAACGIVVTVDGDRVLRVRGDDGASRVARATRARRAAASRPGTTARPRLDRPRLRGVDVSWDELARRPRRRGSTASSPRRGPDAVALYLATGLAYDAAGQIAASQWLPSIGSRSFLTAVTVDNAPVLVAAELVTGEPMLNPVWDPTARGRDGVRRHEPGGVPRLRHRARRPGPPHPRAPRRAAGGCGCSTRAAPRPPALADAHLPVRPGADVAVLGAIARALLEDGADAPRAARPLPAPTRSRALRDRARRLHHRTRRRAWPTSTPTRSPRLIADVRAARGRGGDALRHRRDDGARRRSSPSGCAG